jgi:hypothetical protein
MEYSQIYQRSGLVAKVHYNDLYQFWQLVHIIIAHLDFSVISGPIIALLVHFSADDPVSNIYGLPRFAIVKPEL